MKLKLENINNCNINILGDWIDTEFNIINKPFNHIIIDNFLNEDGYRTKATFIKRPQDEYDDRMVKLYTIRPTRRITDEDMKLIWPEWTTEL